MSLKRLSLILMLVCNTSLCDVLDYKFCSMTPYRRIQNNDLDVGKYPGCEQLKIWMLVRHGTRLPKKKNIDFILEKLPFIKNIIVDNHINSKGSLTVDEVSALINWKPEIPKNAVEKLLMEEGERELLQLGQRTYQRFVEIIDQDLDGILIKSTPTQRAVESANYFCKGMFDEDMDKVNIQVSSDRGDKVLRFYKTCDSWQSHVKKNDKTYSEMNNYIETSEMKQALKDVSNKMGLSEPAAYNMLKQIYSVCGYETAWSLNNTMSPWCALFSNKSLEAFEYAEDIKHYWVDGYGSNLTKRLPCKLLDNVINFFKSDNTSTFYFTHSGTLLKTLAFFGLHEPVELRHDFRDANRPWKTSLIDAFASNIAFVLYKCEDGLKFLTLHQEKPVHLPECDIDEDLCPLDVLIKKNKATKCDLEEMCSLKGRDEL